jgi:hypothetical protein
MSRYNNCSAMNSSIVASNERVPGMRWETGEGAMIQSTRAGTDVYCSVIQAFLDGCRPPDEELHVVGYLW